MVLRRYIFLCDESIFRSSRPIFCSQSTMMLYNMAAYNLLVFVREKLDAALIFTVPEINAKFGLMSGTVKIGLASIFLTLPTHRWLAACLHIWKLDRMQNLGPQILLNQNFHPHPCAIKTHAKMAACLRTHGFGCSSRNTASLGALIGPVIVPKGPWG